MTNFMLNDDFRAVRDFLIDVCEVNEEVIACMCAIHGYTIETLDDVCYWKFGMTCEQMMKEMKGEY